MIETLINNTDEIMRLAADKAQLQSQLALSLTIVIVIWGVIAWCLCMFGLWYGAYEERKNWRTTIEKAMDTNILEAQRKHSWISRYAHDRYRLLRELVELKIKEAGGEKKA